jgi:hypothetical protein
MAAIWGQFSKKFRLDDIQNGKILMIAAMCPWVTRPT